MIDGKRPVFELACKCMRKMVNENIHTEAMLKGVETLKHIVGADVGNLLKKFELLKSLHMMEGHLPHGLSDYRYELYQKMIEIAKESLSEEDFNLFYDSF